MLKLPAGKSDAYFVVGFNDDGSVGAQLQSGQIATVTSDDPNTASISPDSTALVTDEDFTTASGEDVPTGTQSIASGKVSGLAKPAQPNVPINVTCTLTNADGTPVVDDSGAPVPPITDTVTVVPGLLKAEGILFGANPA